MRRRVLFLWMVGVLVPTMVAAQETGAIRGTVTDGKTGKALSGGNVVLKERENGTATTEEGTYELSGIAPGVYTLRATFVGYEKRERTVTVRAGKTTTVNIRLAPRQVQLNEFVVTGQGSGIEARRLSTTTETVRGEEIDAVSAGRLDQALQAQFPSLQIRLNSGQPGTSSLIRSRGPVSASGNTTPVIYVDGVRVDNRSTGSPLFVETGGARSSSIPDLPLENIERIEFVKGGAATTLYGSDAANGVIQIFTKDGKGVSNQFTFSTELGAEYGTKDFLKYDRTGEVIFEDPAFLQRYQLAGQGSAGGMSYSFSGTMYENNAARIGNENIRYDLNASVSATPLETLEYTGTLNAVSNWYTRALNANFTTASLRTETQTFFGEPIDSLDRSSFVRLRDSLQRADALYENETSVRRWQTSQSLQYSPVPSLTVTLKGGLDYRVARNKEVRSNAFLRQTGQQNDQSTIEEFNRDFLGLTLNANVSHRASWRFLDLKTDVGTQIFREETAITRVDADNVPQGSQSVNSAAETTAEDDFSTVAQWGGYIKENVGFGDRLFLDFGLRGDRNSAFGDEIGVVWYPSVGAAYTVTEEPIVRERVPTDIVSTAKLRANYGEAGNFPNAFANETETVAQPFLDGISYTFGNPGNPDLGPERVKTWEVGADFAFFQNRIDLQVTRYRSTTDNALFTPPFPPSSGQDSQQRNLGTVTNEGWEMATQVAILDQSAYDLDLQASLNTNDNMVVSNGGTPKFQTGGFGFLGSYVDAGKPVGYLEANRPIFNDEGEITAVEEDAVLGDPNPDQFGSVSLSGRYRGLHLRVTADYQRGAQGVDLNDPVRLQEGIQDNDRFPNPNDEPVPPALQQVRTGEYSFEDLAGVWVEDTDYLKVRTISLSYDLPGGVLPSTVRSVRVGGHVQNPFNVVESGFDPEVDGSQTAAGTVGGVFAFRTISSPRRYTFTLEVGL